MQQDKSHSGRYHISFVIPAYNEQDIIAYTMHRMRLAFDKAGYRLELVVVDNGSHDRTGEIIQAYAAEHPGVVYCRVPENQGYGNGILQGIPLCTAPWIGMIPADGQVDAEDAVRLYEAVVVSNRPVIGKVRRRFRMDGLRRKLVSISYNALVLMLYPQIGSLDINGSPKILARETLNQMCLNSRGWFLDPEIMIKAHYMDVRVIELNVFARMRGTGVSHVRMETCWEFMRNLLNTRFSSAMQEWRETLPPPEVAPQSDSAVMPF